ncbi:MAG: type II toxin-antitoxin system RelE/ParE family toxin [Patescibacteria group bacterium]
MNSETAWELKVAKSVDKKLQKFPPKDKECIFEVIKLMSQDPYFGDIEKLNREDNSWRRRVGNYRIFYELDINKKIVFVSDVKRRTSKTY